MKILFEKANGILCPLNINFYEEVNRQCKLRHYPRSVRRVIIFRSAIAFCAIVDGGAFPALRDMELYVKHIHRLFTVRRDHAGRLRVKFYPHALIWGPLCSGWITPMVRQTLITVDIITRQLAAFNKCANSIQRMVEPNTLFNDTVAFSRKWTFVLWARSNFKKIEKARNFWKHSLGDYSFIFPEVLRHYFVHYIVTFKERFFKLTPICWIGLEPDEALSGFIRSLPLEDGVPVSNIKTLRQQKLEIFAP